MAPAEPMRDWVIGMDLGGTNIRAAEVDRTGRIGIVVNEAVDHTAGHMPFQQLIEVGRRLIDAVGTPPRAIGLGVTGPVDRMTAVIDNPYTRPASFQACGA